MPVDQLRTDAAPASKNKILGSTYNRLAAMANTPLNGYPVQPGTTGPGAAGIIAGGGMAMIPGQMTMVGAAIVTSIENTCPNDDNEQDSKWAPCRSSKKYLAKWRRWATSSGTWTTTDEDEYAVDLANFWPDETVALTTGPILLVDDIFPAWLDPLRGMLVPLSFPTVRPVILNAALGAGAAVEACVLKRKTTTPFWQRVLDDAAAEITLEVVDLTLNSGDADWEVDTVGLAIWMTNAHLFVPLNCEPSDLGI